MNSSKIMLRIDRASHLDLKLRAIQQGITLNQLCLNFIYAGLKATSEDPAASFEHNLEISQNPKLTAIVERSLHLFESEGLDAILKTEGYVADYVLIFAQMPEGLQMNFKEIVQPLQLPKSVHAPSLMWIEIAQKYELLWSKNADQEKELTQKLDRWGS